jgi:plastocyanin
MAKASRGLWTLVVVLFAVLAVAGPVKMVKTRADADSSGGAAATGDTVVMAKIAFAPTTLTVAKGTEVVFRNDDVAPHTVTAQGGGAVDSGILGPGKTFRLVVNEPLDYFCEIHPQMKAKVLLIG